LSLDDPLAITIIVVGAIIVCAIVIFAMRGQGKRPKKKSEDIELIPELRGYPFKVTKSVPVNEASHAKDELRILDLEREILSDAIRRLYEAHAEGKITEQERERLAETYKARMMLVKDAMSKDESLVALHELETMQEDLMKLFSQKFDDLSSKIDELRSKAQLKSIKEVTITPKILEQAETSGEDDEKTGGEEKAKRKRKPPSQKAESPRTEAEKRIEQIRSEVEKVLDKLGQMEIES
jgi:hypothetical protein